MLPEPSCRLAVELSGRLIEHEHRRLERQRARERYALALATGQLVRFAEGEVRRVGGGQRAIHAPSNRIAGNGEILRTNRDLLLDGAAEAGELSDGIVEDVACQRQRERAVMDLPPRCARGRCGRADPRTPARASFSLPLHAR